MPFDFQHPPLPAMALAIDPIAWIGGAPQTSLGQHDIVWTGIGPDGVPIYARRDGYIVFGFHKAERFAGGEIPSFVPSADGPTPPASVIEAQSKRMSLLHQRVEYMNAFLACLYSAIATVQHNARHVQAPVDPQSYHPVVEQSGVDRILPTLINRTPPQSDRIDVQVETVDRAVDLMRACVTAYKKTTYSLLALTFTACHQYSSHQFSSAHLLGWSIVEMQINRLWEQLLKRLDSSNGGHTRINRDRREILMGNNYTASIVTQMLSLHDSISDDLLRTLDSARKRRNDFVHKLLPVSAEDASQVLVAASDLISRIVGVRVALQIALSYRW